MSLYTITVTDESDLISSEIEAQMIQNAEYVATYISRYINWKGTLDIELKVLPISELTWSDADGLLPANGQISWNGSDWTNDTLHEMLTGVDKDISRADAGALIFVPEDGIVQNYGQEVWFDPNPQFEVTPDIPPGKHDFVSILTHEIFHTIGFYAATTEYQALLVSESGTDLLVGDNIVAELGSGLRLGSPYATGPSDHYASPVGTGLLNEFGAYEQNRWQIGRIDLAVLKDLGHDIKTFEGLATFDLGDQQSELQIPESLSTFYGDYRSTTLIGNTQDNAIFGNGGADTLIGGDGNNTLHGGDGIDTVVLTVPHTQVDIARSDSQLVLTDGLTQNQDTLVNVERIHFSDKKLAFDLDGHAGEAAKVIGVVLGKSGIGNAGAVGTALGLLDAGSSYEQLMQAALDAVFGPDPESATLVNALHVNLTGVPAPNEVISQYAPLLDTGALTALELSQTAAELEQNTTNIDLIGLSSTGLEYLIG